MNRTQNPRVLAIVAVVAGSAIRFTAGTTATVSVRRAVAFDVSAPLASRSASPGSARSGLSGTTRPALSGTARSDDSAPEAQGVAAPATVPVMTTPSGSAAVEQTRQGPKPPAVLVESFDGLGVGFEGPQGTAAVRNPSDNSLAVGPNHIVQTVNSRMAIFTRKGKQFQTTGKVLYGPVATNNVFKDLG